MTALSPTVFSPRASLTLLSFYLLSIAFCLAVPRALTFLPSSIALIGLIVFVLKTRSCPPIDKQLVGIFLAFGALFCASSLWSPDPDYSLGKALKTTLLLLSGLIPLAMVRTINPMTKHKNTLIAVAVLVCALAGAILAVEYHTQFALSRFLLGIETADSAAWPDILQRNFLLNRSSVFLVLLCLPVMLWLRTSDMAARKKNLLSAILFSGIGALMITTNSQTAQIAAILALPMLTFPAQRPKARRLVMLAILAAMLAAPFIITPMQNIFLSTDARHAEKGLMIDASIPHRFEVWTFMSEQIMQAPVLGHGMESTRHLRAGYIMPHMRTDHVLHPHNAALQIWVEFGVVGIALAMGFICFLFAKLDKTSPLMQRYHMVFLIVMLGVLSIGYGLWQAWLIGMIQTLVALALIGARITGADYIKQ